MKVAHVLIVHGDLAASESIRTSLREKGIRVSLAHDAQQGLSLIEREPVHLLVADPDAPGVDDGFLRNVASAQPLVKILALVAPRSLETARRHIHVSQVDFLLKPLTADAIRTALRSALDSGAETPCAEEEPKAAALREAASRAATLHEAPTVIAQSPAMRDILRLVPKIARTDATVLIQGEPDTGKALIAAEIHRQSRRADGPFVRIACGGLQEREVDQKLFGEREPAGNNGRPPLLLEQAHRGTLFLDGVSQLPLWAQVRLLDVLQQMGSPRCGTPQAAGVDVRVIASAACDLRAASAEDRFNSSLYYYLSVVEIDVPPLRHRPQDVRAIADHYLATANAARGASGEGRPRRFSTEAYERLLAYDWPGNTLQLAGVVARAVVLAVNEEIASGDIAESLGKTACHSDCESIRVSLAGGLKGIERSVIEAVIQQCRGNKAAAARALRLHRRTLYRLLQQDEVADVASPAASRAIRSARGPAEDGPLHGQHAM